MGHSQALRLLDNKADLTEEAGQEFVGGRAALVVTATSFPTALNLQLEHVDGTWVNINSSTINANGVYNYDLPQGRYRMFLNGGSAAGLYASLSKVKY